MAKKESERGESLIDWKFTGSFGDGDVQIYRYTYPSMVVQCHCDKDYFVSSGFISNMIPPYDFMSFLEEAMYFG